MTTMYREMVAGNPALEAGRVECLKCKRTRTVDSAACLRSGWPTCCGETMRLVGAAPPTAGPWVRRGGTG